MAHAGVISTARRAASLARLTPHIGRLNHHNEKTRTAAKAFLTSQLAESRGLPMKVGQVIATLGGENSAFAPLCEPIEPWPFDQIRPALEAGLGRPIDEVFAAIEPRGIAASLGQVHRATLHDGRDVAVKVRYPDIAGAVDAELRLLGWLPRMGPAKRFGFDIAGYKAALGDSLRAELDYLGEADRQQRYRQTVQVDGLVVPAVYEELCSESVLVQAWEDASPMTAAARWPRQMRGQLAELLIQATFTGLLRHGIAHADPHPGNVRVRVAPGGRPQLVLVDYGSVIDLPEPARLAMIKLLIGCHDDDATDPLAALCAMGFDAAKLADVAPVLPALCKLLLEPFTSDERFSLNYWEVGERIDALLGELKWWFRSAGPPAMLLPMRVMHGLIRQIEQLSVALPWWPIVEQAIGMTERRSAATFALPAPPMDTADRSFGFDGLATLLKVRIERRGGDQFAVSLPATQTPHLTEHIPPDALRRIESRGINVSAIVKHAIEQGLRPRELFDVQLDEARYRVWLERDSRGDGIANRDNGATQTRQTRQTRTTQRSIDHA